MSENSTVKANKEVGSKHGMDPMLAINGSTDSRLTSRLCYLLRYGALKEGMDVNDKGYIDINELMNNRLMTHHKKGEVLTEIETSVSKRGSLRFEKMVKDGRVFVRSRFCRRFDRNPYHTGTKVPTLLETGMRCVTQNIHQFELEGFPAENIINTLLHRLKREKKLNGSVFRSLLSSTLEHLDLSGLYLTDGMLRAVRDRCPNIRVLSLQDSGYIVNDHLLEQTARKLNELESLNLAGCSKLTDKSLTALRRHCSLRLKHLNISMIRGLSETAIINLMKDCVYLQYLDIFDHRISADCRQKIIELAREKKTIVVLRGLEDPDVAPEDPCMFLPNFGKVWY